MCSHLQINSPDSRSEQGWAEGNIGILELRPGLCRWVAGSQLPEPSPLPLRLSISRKQESGAEWNPIMPAGDTGHLADIYLLNQTPAPFSCLLPHKKMHHLIIGVHFLENIQMDFLGGGNYPLLGHLYSGAPS